MNNLSFVVESSKVCISGYISYIIKKIEINALRRGMYILDELWNYLDRISRCVRNMHHHFANRQRLQNKY